MSMDMCTVIWGYIDLYMDIALAHMALCLSWWVWTGRTANSHGAGEKGMCFIFIIIIFYIYILGDLRHHQLIIKG